MNTDLPIRSPTDTVTSSTGKSILSGTGFGCGIVYHSSLVQFPCVVVMRCAYYFVPCTCWLSSIETLIVYPFLWPQGRLHENGLWQREPSWYDSSFVAFVFLNVWLALCVLRMSTIDSLCCGDAPLSSSDYCIILMETLGGSNKARVCCCLE